MIEVAMMVSSVILAVLLSMVIGTNLVVVLSWVMKRKEVVFVPNVSVIIPVYNGAHVIDACLQSIAAAEYPKEKVEIIVVDDGSIDTTKERVRVWKNIKIVHKHHEGKAKALTAGVKAAQFDCVVTIDADTLIEKDCLRKMVAQLNDLRVGAVAGFTKVKNKNSIWCAFQNVEYFYNNVVRRSFSRIFGHTVWFHGALAGYRKSAS